MTEGATVPNAALTLPPYNRGGGRDDGATHSRAWVPRVSPLRHEHRAVRSSQFGLSGPSTNTPCLVSRRWTPLANSTNGSTPLDADAGELLRSAHRSFVFAADKCSVRDFAPTHREVRDVRYRTRVRSRECVGRARGGRGCSPLPSKKQPRPPRARRARSRRRALLRWFAPRRCEGARPEPSACRPRAIERC